jgi:lysophospholipase L1-like esterase
VRVGIPEPNPESQFEHWATLLDPRLAFRNCGVYGQRTDEIALRLETCAEDADMLIVQGGINDIAQRHRVEKAAENLLAMVRRGRELGLDVVVANVLPWNSGYPEAEEPIRRLNALIAAIGAPVLEFHDTLEDPRRPARMRAEWTSDGDHPSVEGYRMLGAVVARGLSR